MKLFRTKKQVKQVVPLRTDFLQGHIVAKSMNSSWLEIWRQSAEVAERDNNELVVFCLPKNEDSEKLINDVQLFIRQKLHEYYR